MTKWLLIALAALFIMWLIGAYVEVHMGINSGFYTTSVNPFYSWVNHL